MTPEQARERVRAFERSKENAALCGFTHTDWMALTRKERKDRTQVARKALAHKELERQKDAGPTTVD